MSERQRLCCWALGRKHSTVRVRFRCPDMPILIKAQEKIVCLLTSKPIKESDRSGTFYQPAGTYEEYYKGENARLRPETATIRLQKHAPMIFLYRKPCFLYKNVYIYVLVKMRINLDYNSFVKSKPTFRILLLLRTCSLVLSDCSRVSYFAVCQTQGVVSGHRWWVWGSRGWCPLLLPAPQHCCS